MILSAPCGQDFGTLPDKYRTSDIIEGLGQKVVVEEIGMECKLEQASVTAKLE